MSQIYYSFFLKKTARPQEFLACSSFSLFRIGIIRRTKEDTHMFSSTPYI
jgi:hypothetical protein